MNSAQVPKEVTQCKLLLLGEDKDEVEEGGFCNRKWIHDLISVRKEMMFLSCLFF